MISYKQNIRLSLSIAGLHKCVTLIFFVKDGSIESRQLGQEFVDLIYEKMPRNTGWFHQSGTRLDDLSSDYHMFEFWNYQTTKEIVVSISRDISNELDLELVIDAELIADIPLAAI